MGNEAAGSQEEGEALKYHHDGIPAGKDSLYIYQRSSSSIGESVMAKSRYEEDVTRKAVVRASGVTARVKEILKAQLFTGPTNVSLTPAQLREEMA